MYVETEMMQACKGKTSEESTNKRTTIKPNGSSSRPSRLEQGGVQERMSSSLLIEDGDSWRGASMQVVTITSPSRMFEGQPLN